MKGHSPQCCLADTHNSVKAGSSPKQQALDVICLLREKSDFPIAYAPMQRMKMSLRSMSMNRMMMVMLRTTHVVGGG
jgi:hypothetical protein